MAFGFVPIIHIVAGVLAIIELGLTGYIVSRYHYFNWGYRGESPDRADFMLFASIWSILVLLYVGITPLYLTRAFHRIAALVLEAITAIFWFAGSIALAVFIGVPQCHGDNLCGTYQAAVAFGFFLWVAFTALTVIDGLEAMRSRGHHSTTTTTHGPKGPTIGV